MRDDALALVAARLGRLAVPDAPLAPLTTYKVGGRAALLASVATEADLAAVRDAVAGTGVPVLVVGKGSNLLVADAGFPGLAVVLGDGFAEIDVLAGHRVRAGAAVSLPVLARRTAAASLTGFEWAVGVPGSVGGAVRMNAGGHGSDMAACLSSYRFVDLAGGEDGTFGAERLAYAYRSSSVEPTHVVVWAELALRPGDREASEATIADIVRWRRENQPGGQNAGSVFTNPPGDSAGRLIDACGLKGLRRGSAYVSEKHANFIQADPAERGGSADDVAALIAEVARRVADQTGIALHPEVRMVGFTDPQPSTQPSGGGAR